jgi:hypothetical protein
MTYKEQKLFRLKSVLEAWGMLWGKCGVGNADCGGNFEGHHLMPAFH